jgi:integrase
MAELGRFLERIVPERLGPVWAFIATTGCRRGEALGLRGRDVDLDVGTVTFVNTRTIAGGSIVEGATKTAAGARTITIDDDLVGMMRAVRLVQRRQYVALGLRLPMTTCLRTRAAPRSGLNV